jgi:hypothetical protein
VNVNLALAAAKVSLDHHHHHHQEELALARRVARCTMHAHRFDAAFALASSRFYFAAYPRPSHISIRCMIGQ